MNAGFGKPERSDRLARRCAAAIVALACLCLAIKGGAARADAVEDFYRGNTIKLHVSASAGGTYDLAARVFVKHFSGHVPGRPNVIVLNMPGTVGTANWLYGAAEKDGAILGMPNQSVPMNQVVTPANVRYDAVKFNWIGNLEGATGIVFTYHTSTTRSFQDARLRESIMGVPTRASTAYQLLALSNRLLDTKFKIISGYERNRVIAMESGEIDGTASNIENLAGLAPHWLPKSLVNVLLVNATKRSARAPEAPTMLELTNNPTHKQILEVIMLQAATARAIVAPPGVPAERVQALRRAFDRTAADPHYLADVEKARLEIDSTSGEETQQAVARLVATKPEIITMVLEAIK
jgi:tripartite-type tricarboxylate transporter receptor subunit TctC